MKRLTFELPPSLYRDLKHYCFDNDLKMKEVLCLAIGIYLKKGFLEELSLRETLNKLFKDFT
jgi:hypothetical protein